MTPEYWRPGLTEGVLLRRVWAWLIDIVAIAILATLLWLVVFALGLLTLGLGFGLMAVLPLIPLLYHTLFLLGDRTATPGQALLGLTVRRDRDLGPPDLVQAILFTGGLWLTLSIGLWPLLAALFTDRKRALHDIVSGLVVVRSEALTRDEAFANMRIR